MLEKLPWELIPGLFFFLGVVTAPLPNFPLHEELLPSSGNLGVPIGISLYGFVQVWEVES